MAPNNIGPAPDSPVDQKESSPSKSTDVSDGSSSEGSTLTRRKQNGAETTSTASTSSTADRDNDFTEVIVPETKKGQMSDEHEAESKETPSKEDDDPWVVAVIPDDSKPWKEKNTKERVETVAWGFAKAVALLSFLYFFICSLDLLSDAFRLIGGKTAGEVFRNSALMNNPIANLMIGVLVTVLLQSSSTTTSIIVTMVAAGILPVQPAIYMVMGANIGTSVTNTIVAMGHVAERDEFRRGFAGATVHDMFNWLSVICILPIEWISGEIGDWKGCGILCQMTGAMMEGLKPEGDQENPDFLKVITQPFTQLIMQLDKSVLNDYVTLNDTELEYYNKSLVKHDCPVEGDVPYVAKNNETGECELKWETGEIHEYCKFLFEYVSRSWSDAAVGVALLLLSLTTLTLCLFFIVKLLHSILKGKVAVWLKTFVNADFPGYARHLTGYLAIVLGAGLTMLVQSSSIFTSTLTPLVAIGVITLERVYPLTLGANIGTTFTSILAALASDGDMLYLTLQVALTHLFFNIFGILIWYPVPRMRRIPIGLAKSLGNTTAQYRWFALMYLFLMFFLFPGFVFGLSLGGQALLLGLGIPLLLLFIAIVVINNLQDKKPNILPPFLRTWDFLPLPMHSLEPYDRLFKKINALCCKCCHSETRVEPEEEAVAITEKSSGSHNTAFEKDTEVEIETSKL